MKISKNFTVGEFTRSDTAKLLDICNDNLSEEVLENIKLLVDNILQPLRDSINRPIVITSGYRCPLLNTAIGSKPTSQHVMGQACDLKVNGMRPYDVAKRIIDLGLNFDQLILYDSFCHVSYSKRNRKQIVYDKSYKGVSLTK